MPISVFLADDHELLVDGFKSHLESEAISVIDTANTLVGLEEKFTKSNADVLVIDLRFNSESQTGLDMAAKLLQKDPGVKIILLSQFDSPYIIENAYKIGVLAFVGKNDTENLTNAIRAAASGTKYLSPEIAQKLAMESIETKNPKKLLTPQEIKIFTMIADGLTPLAIANEQGVTYKTVNTTVSSIRAKLGIETYAEFTKVAIKYGLLKIE
jgi:two-component system invasion response regulator UvrY